MQDGLTPKPARRLIAAGAPLSSPNTPVPRRRPARTLRRRRPRRRELVTNTILFVQQLLNGLLAGAHHLLIALGLSLIFSLGGIVNLAHGAFYALGAYLVVALGPKLGFAGGAGVARHCRHPRRHHRAAAVPPLLQAAAGSLCC